MENEVFFELITPLPDVDGGDQENLAELQKKLGFQLREMAKRISVSKPFQSDIQRLRQEWDIPTPADTDLRIDVEAVVQSYWKTLEAPAAAKLKRDVRSLITSYGLDPLRHWGLVLVALFYGITPKVVIDQWDRVESLALRGSPRVLQTDDLMRPDKERLVLLSVIKWLWLYVTQKDRSLRFPEPVRRVIDDAVFMDNGPEVWGDLDALSEYIERTLSGEPVPTLLIPVDEYTSLAEVRRTWPLIEQSRDVFLDRTQPERKEWVTYVRDVELMALVEELGNYDDVIKAYHRRHPDENFINYGIISDDVRDLVRQAVFRARERAV